MSRVPRRGGLERTRRGFLFLRQAQLFLTRDSDVAYRDQDWSTAIRRAQEATEFAAKALFLLAGQEYPKEHAISTRQRLARGTLPAAFDEGSARRVQRLPFVLERDRSGGLSLLKELAGVRTQIGYVNVSIDSERPFGLRVEGEDVLKVVVGDKEVLSSQDSLVAHLRARREQLRLIDDYVARAARMRALVFYLEVTVTQADADRARKEAWDVLGMVLRVAGVELGR